MSLKTIKKTEMFQMTLVMVVKRTFIPMKTLLWKGCGLTVKNWAPAVNNFIRASKISEAAATDSMEMPDFLRETRSVLAMIILKKTANELKMAILNEMFGEMNVKYEAVAI